VNFHHGNGALFCCENRVQGIHFYTGNRCRINRNKLLLQPEIRAVEAFHFTFCIIDFLLKLTALLVLSTLGR